MPAKNSREEARPSGGGNWRKTLHDIIFEADTPSGKLFDVVLLILIALSVLVVMLESVDSISSRMGRAFGVLEWILTIMFTIEYVTRLMAVRKPLRYATSFFGIVDLLAILPTYLSLFFPGTQSLAVIRALRLLRLFRIFKLARYVEAYTKLQRAIALARPKIIVFMIAVLTIVTIVGSLMYLLEGEQDSGFENIPVSIYWAIVTVTTVGYGDISPTTELGQFLAAVLMITGYAIIAVPTGLVSAEIAAVDGTVAINTQHCRNCAEDNHHDEAVHCHRCGVILEFEEV